MAKRNKKIDNAAHIKRHTVGTSNELSFSVLDAAKNLADVEEGKQSKVKQPRFGAIPLFSLRRKKLIATPTRDDSIPLSAAQSQEAEKVDYRSTHEGAKKILQSTSSLGTSVISSPNYPTGVQGEIDRRKAHRRKKRRSLVAVVATLAVVVVGASSFFLVGEVKKNQGQLSYLQQAAQKIYATDEIITQIDHYTEATLESEPGQLNKDFEDQIKQASLSLKEAEDLAESASTEQNVLSDTETLNQIKAAVASRQQLIVTGQTIILAKTQTEVGIVEAQKAWDQILDADSIIREAADLVTETTAENVNAAKEKSGEALFLLKQALQTLNTIETYTTAPDLSLQIRYIEKRIEAIQHGLASDDAILKEDKEFATIENDLYNAADAEATELARQMSLDITDPLIKAYESKTEEPRKIYVQERNRANAADTFLRNNLGT